MHLIYTLPGSKEPGPQTGPAGAAMVDEQLQEALRENARLTERFLAAEQQVSDLANLYVAVNSLHGATEPPAVIAAVCEIVANLVGSEELALFETEPRSGHIRLVAASGVDAALFDALEVGRGVIGGVAESGRPFVRREGGNGTPGTESSITACLPLRVRTAVAGVLVIFRLLPHKGTLEERDLDLFDALSAHVAPALLFSRFQNGVRA
jgi:hypothetical protein